MIVLMGRISPVILGLIGNNPIDTLDNAKLWPS